MTEPRPVDLMQRIARAAGHIDPRLTPGDIDRLVEGSHRKRRRRAIARACSFAVGVGVAAGGALLGTRSRPMLPQSHGGPGAESAQVEPAPLASLGPARAPSPSPRSLRLVDGSEVTAIDPASELAVLDQSQHRVLLELARGRERFDVTPIPERSFSVQAGDVTVTVVGTVFTVERVADRVGVAVEKGTVRVDWESGTRYVRAGESGWFPPVIVRPEVPMPTRRGEVTPAPASSGRGAAGGASAGELLSAADTARLAGRNADAVALLEQVLREHRDDARAPLAAFTLGRVLLIELAQPREAARAFARARALAPSGPFAEDSLAREAEAWAKAGQFERARASAQAYMRLYPNGRRTDAVKSFGSLP